MLISLEQCLPPTHDPTFTMLPANGVDPAALESFLTLRQVRSTHGDASSTYSRVTRVLRSWSARVYVYVYALIWRTHSPMILFFKSVHLSLIPAS